MPILLDNVKCRGDESTIAACRHNGWRQNDCDHSEDASVVCWRETAPPVQGTAFNCNNFYQNLSVTYFHQNAFLSPNSYEEQQFTNSLVLLYILIRSTKCIKTYSNELGCKKNSLDVVFTFHADFLLASSYVKQTMSQVPTLILNIVIINIYFTLQDQLWLLDHIQVCLFKCCLEFRLVYHVSLQRFSFQDVLCAHWSYGR